LIIFSSRTLEIAISEGQLVNRTKVNYLILPMVLSSLSGPFFVFRPTYGEPPPELLHKLLSMVCSILAAYLTYRGIIQCYFTNKQFDGMEFFERFAILFVPPLMKMVVITVPPSFLLFTMVNKYELLSHVLPSMFVILGPLVVFIFYRMLNNSFYRLGCIITKSSESA